MNTKSDGGSKIDTEINASTSVDKNGNDKNDEKNDKCEDDDGEVEYKDDEVDVDKNDVDDDVRVRRTIRTIKGWGENDVRGETILFAALALSWSLTWARAYPAFLSTGLYCHGFGSDESGVSDDDDGNDEAQDEDDCDEYFTVFERTNEDEYYLRPLFDAAYRSIFGREGDDNDNGGGKNGGGGVRRRRRRRAGAAVATTSVQGRVGNDIGEASGDKESDDDYYDDRKWENDRNLGYGIILPRSILTAIVAIRSELPHVLGGSGCDSGGIEGRGRGRGQGEGGVAIDLGSGDGRALISSVLSCCGLRSAVGIEIVPQLHDDALRTLHLWEQGFGNIIPQTTALMPSGVGNGGASGNDAGTGYEGAGVAANAAAVATKVSFLCGDFRTLAPPILPDATLVIVHATLFDDGLMRDVEDMCLEHCSDHAVFIAVTRPLGGDDDDGEGAGSGGDNDNNDDDDDDDDNNNDDGNNNDGDGGYEDHCDHNNDNGDQDDDDASSEANGKGEDKGGDDGNMRRRSRPEKQLRRPPLRPPITQAQTQRQRPRSFETLFRMRLKMDWGVADVYIQRIGQGLGRARKQGRGG